jgi:HSP20 family protein
MSTWFPKKMRREVERLPTRFSLAREMGGLFPELFEDIGTMKSARDEWVPSLDIAETETDVMIKAEVPGIDPKELDISVSDNILKIKGEKKEEKEEKTKSFHRCERSYGSFTRSVTLPAEVDASEIEAKAKDGILTITIPKHEVKEEQKVKIEVS